MINLPNKLVIFGAIAAAALVVPGVLGPLMFEKAYAQRGIEQEIDRVEQNAAGVVAANVNVGANVAANVEDNEIAACVIVGECDVDQ